MRLELIRPKSLPPQDSVYTNFTTSALPQPAGGQIEESSLSRRRCQTRSPGNILRLRIWICRDFALLNTTRRRRWNRRRFYRILHHTASRFWRAGSEIGQRKAGRKEDRGQHRGGATEEIRRTRGAEKAARSTAPEGGTHVGTLAVLHQHKADHTDRRQDVHRQNYRKKIFHITS